MQICIGIVTHTHPHLDEIAAIWLLKKFGKEKYPGVETAKIECWPAGDKTPDGRDVQEWEAGGYIIIGTAGGRFDEHPNGDEKRKEDECAFTLVAKNLGMDNDPVLEKIARFVLTNDLKAASHPFDLAHIALRLHSQFPNDPEKVIEWVTVGLEAKYHEQYQFVEVAKKEFEEKAVIEDVDGPGGNILKMVTIESDNEQMNKFARSSHGCEAAIVIQRQITGNTQIFTNRKFGLKIYDIVQIIRILEQEAGDGLKKTDWKELASEGRVEGIEKWWFFEEDQTLLNGSLTNKKVPPTKLSLKQIQNAVLLGINPYQFDPKFAAKCNEGVCCSSMRNQCPLYKYGLHRCRKIRFEMRNK